MRTGTSAFRQVVSFSVMSTLTVCASFALASEPESRHEGFLRSIRSVNDVKDAVRSAIHAIDRECPSGSCVESNSIQICAMTAGLDIRTEFAITAPGSKGMRGGELPIGQSDVELFRLIWRQCKPTTYQYWNYPMLVHVSYEPDQSSAERIRRALNIRSGEDSRTASRPS